MRGRPYSVSANLGAQILTLYPPPSRVTVPDLARTTGTDARAITRALNYLRKQGRAIRTDATERQGRHNVTVWEIKP